MTKSKEAYLKWKSTANASAFYTQDYEDGLEDGFHAGYTAGLDECDNTPIEDVSKKDD